MNPYSYTPETSLFSGAQRKALDMIGLALKHHRIDFKTAALLSQMVKAGQVADVLKRLRP